MLSVVASRVSFSRFDDRGLDDVGWAIAGQGRLLPVDMHDTEQSNRENGIWQHPPLPRQNVPLHHSKLTCRLSGNGLRHILAGRFSGSSVHARNEQAKQQ